MKAFKTQLQIDLNTGETKEVSSEGCPTISSYFASLTILNSAAHVYGCVYLATDAALRELKTRLNEE